MRALRYEVFPTLALTALLSVTQLFSIATNLMVLPDGPLLYMNSVQSARLGIALIALGPMAVAIVNGARATICCAGWTTWPATTI